LLHNASDNTIYSSVTKLWILSVDPKLNSSTPDYSGDLQECQFKCSSDTTLILSQAIETIPVFDPNFVRLHGAIFESLLFTKSQNDLSADRELKDSFQEILLSCSQRTLSTYSPQDTDLADINTAIYSIHEFTCHQHGIVNY
jgi:hypothetical protein